MSDTPPGFFQTDAFGNILQAAGMSMLSSPRGAPLAGMGSYLPALQQQSQQRLKESKEEARKNKTLEYLQAQHPEIAEMVNSGMDIGEAFNYSLKKQQMAQGPEQTADQRNWALAQKDPKFAQFLGVGSAGKAPQIVEQFDENGAPRKMVWDANSGAYVPFGGSKAAPNNSDMSMTLPDGTQINLGGKLTEGQSKDVGFYQRGNAAIPTIDANSKAIADGTQRALDGVPLAGNFMTSTSFQLGKQAGREFLAALLRKDSGAAITPDEEKYYGDMYLPQPGDQKQVLEQKSAARARALEAIKLGLGTASDLARAPVTQNPTSGPAVIDGYTIEMGD